MIIIVRVIAVRRDAQSPSAGSAPSSTARRPDGNACANAERHPLLQNSVGGRVQRTEPIGKIGDRDSVPPSESVDRHPATCSKGSVTIDTPACGPRLPVLLWVQVCVQEIGLFAHKRRRINDLILAVNQRPPNCATDPILGCSLIGFKNHDTVKSRSDEFRDKGGVEPRDSAHASR